MAGGIAEVFRDGSGCGGAGDAGQLNLDAEVLVLDTGTHIDFSLSLVGECSLLWLYCTPKKHTCQEVGEIFLIMKFFKQIDK